MIKVWCVLVFLIVMASFQSSIVQAVDLSKWEKSIVKLTSSPCQLGRPLFEGSGILFVYQNRFFVVTSEHVLIHDTTPQNCLNASNRFLKPVPGKIIRTDYFAGLALLEFKASEDLKSLALNWGDLKSSEGSDAQLIAMGVPAGAEQLQILNQGQLVTSQGRRALIPGVKIFIEANMLPVEFGMSGGLLLQGDPARFAGIISHQFLKRDPGHSTSVGTVGEDSGIRSGDLAIAIPALEVRSWLIETLALKPDQAFLDWVRKPDSQLNHIEEICYAVLCFQILETKASDLAGVGGRGDGAGVGGDEAETGSPNTIEEGVEKLQVIEVSLNPTADEGSRAEVFSDQLLEDFRISLLRGQRVLIGFLKLQEAQRLVKFSSLDQFFTLWWRDHLTPVATKSRDKNLERNAALLTQSCRYVQTLAQEHRDRATEANQKSWFAMIRDQALMAENSLITPAELEASLQKTNDVFWIRFYENDFDQATELEAAIRKVIDQMKKMRLK